MSGTTTGRTGVVVALPFVDVCAVKRVNIRFTVTCNGNASNTKGIHEAGSPSHNQYSPLTHSNATTRLLQRDSN